MDDDGGSGIVWMVDGEERPFEPVSRARRPWLEESTAWVERNGESEPDEGEKDEPPRLEWL